MASMALARWGMAGVVALALASPAQKACAQDAGAPGLGAAVNSTLTWYNDIPSAYRAASQDGRKILIFFSYNESKNSRYLADVVFNDPTVVAMLRSGYVMVKLDYDQNAEVARKLNVYRAGSLLVYDSKGNGLKKIDEKMTPAEFAAILSQLSGGDPTSAAATPTPAPAANPGTALSPPPAVPAVVPPGAFLIDDFSSRSAMKNQLGGRWGAFCALDRNDIFGRIVEEPPGNPAYEVRGTEPPVPGSEVSWGGFFCDLSEDRRPRDLSSYRALQFKARSETLAGYQVRVENPKDSHNATNVPFQPTAQAQVFTIPMSDFKSGVSQGTVITWTLQHDKAGAPFHIVIDDVMLVK